MRFTGTDFKNYEGTCKWQVFLVTFWLWLIIAKKFKKKEILISYFWCKSKNQKSKYKALFEAFRVQFLKCDPQSLKSHTSTRTSTLTQFIHTPVQYRTPISNATHFQKGHIHRAPCTSNNTLFILKSSILTITILNMHTQSTLIVFISYETAVLRKPCFSTPTSFLRSYHHTTHSCTTLLVLQLFLFRKLLQII